MKRFTGSIVVVIGSLLFLLGLVGVPIALLGALDPVEAQLSNDPDPFGSPRSNMAYALMALAYCMATIAGFVLVRWGKKQSAKSQ